MNTQTQNNWFSHIIKIVPLVGAIASIGIFITISFGNVTNSTNSHISSLENSIDRRLTNIENILGAASVTAAEDRRFYQKQAAEDRRTSQASMDDFKRQMLGLSDRQSRLEGVVDTVVLERFGIDRSS